MSASVPFEKRYALVRRGAVYRTVNGVGLFTLPVLDAGGLFSHGFSGRSGGVSPGPFSSLNLSFTRPEDVNNVRENYLRFAAAAGFDPASMVMDSYEHGVTVRRVDQSDCGSGYTKEPLPICDGLVTNDPAVTLITGHADCMAFFITDPAKRAIGLAHAGWRGALGRIGKALVEKMCAAFGSDPAELIVGVGPSICPDCFEVGADVAELFEEAFPDVPCRFIGKSGKDHIDLWRIAAAQFFEAGVQPDKLTISGVCTVEDDRLFSYRRAKGTTGGMAAFLRLR